MPGHRVRPAVRESILNAVAICPRSERGLCGLYQIVGTATGADQAEIDAALRTLHADGRIHHRDGWWQLYP